MKENLIAGGSNITILQSSWASPCWVRGEPQRTEEHCDDRNSQLLGAVVVGSECLTMGVSNICVIGAAYHELCHEAEPPKSHCCNVVWYNSSSRSELEATKLQGQVA